MILLSNSVVLYGVNMVTDKGRIGLVAGGGQFPLMFAEEARGRGLRVFVVAHHNETSVDISKKADDVCWLKLGQLGKAIKYFQKNGVKEIAFAGSITKTRMFKDIFPDIKGLTLWNKIDYRQDDAILRAVAGAFEQEGIVVLPSTVFLQKLIFPAASISKRKPTAEEWRDICFGWQVNRGIGRLDIGQSVVVKDRTVLAVEAIEGTDATIKRGGSLASGGAVVVKLCKPEQDFRFDLPATGSETIKTMVASGCKVLAVEAGKALIFDRQEMVCLADEAGVSIVGVEEQEGTLYCDGRSFSLSRNQ